MSKPDDEMKTPASHKRGPAGSRSLLTASVILFVASAAALAGAWAFASGAIGTVDQDAHNSSSDYARTLSLAASRADLARSPDELTFLSSLAEVPANSSSATHDAAARLHFAVAGGLYDGGSLEAAKEAAKKGAEHYAAAGRKDGASANDLWLQLKNRMQEAKASRTSVEDLASWEEAAKRAEGLAAIDQQNLAFMKLNVTSNLRAADFAKKGNELGKAATFVASAIVPAKQLADARTDNVAAQRDYWVALFTKGDVALQTDKVEEAIEAFSQALQVAEKSAPLTSKDRSQRDLYSSQLKLADAKARGNDISGASEAYKSALEIGSAMYAASQSIPDQRNVLQAQLRLAGLKRTAKDFAGSSTLFEDAVKTARAIATSDSQNVAYLRDLARSYWGSATTKADLKDNQGALSMYRATAELRAKILTIDASNPADLRDCAATYEKLALVSKEAAAWKLAVQFAEQLAQHSAASDADKQLLSRIKAGAAKA